jgi:hypothetical protein
MNVHKTQDQQFCQLLKCEFLHVPFSRSVSRKQLLQVLVESGYRPNLKATVQLDEVHVPSEKLMRRTAPVRGMGGEELTLVSVCHRSGPL